MNLFERGDIDIRVTARDSFTWTSWRAGLCQCKTLLGNALELVALELICNKLDFHAFTRLATLQTEWMLRRMTTNASLYLNTRQLRLPCTFRGVSSLTHALYIADIVAPYEIKAYKIWYKMMKYFSILMNRRVSWDPSARMLWSSFTSFNSKWFLFFNNPIRSRESR